MAVHISSSSSFQSHNLAFLLRPSSFLSTSPESTAWNTRRRRSIRFTCQASGGGDEDYLLDAPVSVGDGFSFSGGKYSDEPNPADEWFRIGKIVKAHPVIGSGKKAKDPIFGLTMGSGSQASDDVFRWFCVESGSIGNPSVILIHGLPSQWLRHSYVKACFFSSLRSPRMQFQLQDKDEHLACPCKYDRRLCKYH